MKFIKIFQIRVVYKKNVIVKQEIKNDIYDEQYFVNII